MEVKHRQLALLVAVVRGVADVALHCGVLRATRAAQLHLRVVPKYEHAIGAYERPGGWNIDSDSDVLSSPAF